MSTFEENLRQALSPAYDLERELTGAGMSRVFVATDKSLGRRVVIKVLPPELTAGVNRERFRREIQVAAQLQHPHIVTLLSAGEEGDLLYYTMPYIEGESLRHSLEKGPLAVKDVVRILHDVVDALAYAHARGVIHRDIKPGNILRQGSHALVTDFGVAKALNAAMPISGITSAGMAIGTPAYMAPEQLAGDPAADNRIDIYAVGLLAYELLTGESPFTGPSPQATMAAQLTRDPEPLHLCCPDVPEPLSAIIMQCLAKLPEQRPPTAEALMTALDSITTSSGDIKTPATPVLPAVSSRRRRMTVAVGIATVIFGSAMAMYASVRHGVETTVTPRDTTATVKSSAAPPTSARPTPAQPAAASAPITLSRQDSLAIALAVQQRLTQEEALRGKEQVAVLADSITTLVRRVAIDSILRATLPPGVPIPGWRDVTPPEMHAIRRVVVTEPRSGRFDNLNDLGGALADSIRRALMKRKGYSVVDPDSVSAALAVSRQRADVERTLKPDVLITPTFVGQIVNDSITVVVSMRDVHMGSFGTRVATAKIPAADGESAIPALVQNLMGQLEGLAHFPRYIKVQTNREAQGNRER
ncbi:MAG TPA: serine/threonine-protein kinase [Gemmatimonadaceae bacterium]|nr:serine/threonine-protein kinase [Gemmatimonadaceae bacterium]